jgi:alkylation response protein AidB-like acyl-CoA dehydrogenase
MNNPVSEQHRLIQKTARDFANSKILPIAAQHDESATFPIETIRELGALGFMAMEASSEHGGSELDTISYVLALTEIAKADASHATIMSVSNSLYCAGIDTFGTEKQKEKFLAPVAKGVSLGAYSLTEPDSGSDASNMSSTAVLNKSHYVINGTKAWVTGAPYADFILLFTMTAPEKKDRGITAFLIDCKQEGFSLGKPEPKLGIRASSTSEIIFDNYECPVENRLGDEGQGLKIALGLLDAGRIGVAAQALGLAEAAMEKSIEYAQQRESFGKKIAQYQMIQQKLADMKCRVEASRLLIHQAAYAKEESKRTGNRFSLEASMAKLFASETAMWTCTQAVQIHGGMGYSKELPLERYFRDAKITEIYEGTSEIQRMLIARLLTGLK